MKLAAPLRLALLSAFLALPSAAQDVDAGPPAALTKATGGITPFVILDAGAKPAPAPVAASPDAGMGPTISAAPVTPPAPVLDNPAPFVQVIFKSVEEGNWWAAASAFLVVVVSLLRTYGKKLHEKLPDNELWDKPLWFIFDTKPGGWVLNLLTAISGGVGTSLLAGVPVTWALVKPVVMVAVTGSALWELGKDLFEWTQAKGAAAAATPPPPAPTVKP
jgi:hypothetical protein